MIRGIAQFLYNGAGGVKKLSAFAKVYALFPPLAMPKKNP
ncbi:hypothetical protein AVDCRST_MAG84-6840 [uncultured Microcoleus sp.]|uniref:Uncharacterized protein n=1 Tax=uncultured Microcoleus sp. TaxID=259945 RepID=A0A6J4PJJ8_9CYAN|nr:hypothetical protein AVDCRST_MAG84-6840 [uncultured Microcoleus sp.]